ncbi:hypothetical protein GAYE_SCF19G3964 [Galdieria yellowstonensis]|uniref:Uncharacterized protein n=1 Tax=Galdieria yellowstonensis TaxID=3028027 RepID=A0AAV9IFC9_9RHOD|nr:hypothetical protein GAYE_SCF19G3964 [Galdieria yellowstonensis]
MAQNIPLIRVQEEWLPLPYENELFILSRKGVDCEIRNERFNQTCSDGSLVLTTQRLVFVHKQAQPQRPTMESFEAPLYGIWNEEFHQPILAANYLTCDVQPFDDQPFSGIVRCKFSFKQGGVGVFLPIFFTLLSLHRQRRQQSSSAAQVNHEQLFRHIQQRCSAFVDPSDPTRIYVAQPAPSDWNSQPQQRSPSSSGLC